MSAVKLVRCVLMAVSSVLFAVKSGRSESNRNVFVKSFNSTFVDDKLESISVLHKSISYVGLRGVCVCVTVVFLWLSLAK